MSGAEIRVGPSGSWRWRAEAAAIAAIPLIVAAIYGRALFAPFYFDDSSTILLNPTVQAPATLRAMLANPRPLLNTSFFATFRLSGLSPWGHRLGNIIGHAANALLVYVWLHMLFAVLRAGAGAWPEWLAAVFFAAHPLSVEAVTYISGRADVLVTFFALLALIALAAAHRNRTRPLLSASWAGATLLATMAAVASKETGVVLPVILFVQASVLYGGMRAALRAHAILFACLAAPWALTALLLTSYPEHAQTAGFAFGRSEYGISPRDYLLTQAGVVVRYFRLVVLPYDQVFDYDWPVVRSLRAAVVPGLVLLGCAAVGALAGKRSRLYPFAVLWVFATLAPTSSVVPIADVIAERRMYMPMVGIALLVALVISDAAAACQRRRLRMVWIPAASVVVLLAFGGLAWARNGMWNDPLTLWQDTVRKQPGNPRAHTNLGIRYLQRGNVHDARLALETALDLIAADESAHAIPRHGAFAATHLALAYLELGDAVAAREAYDIAQELGAATYSELHNVLQRVARTLAAVGQGDPDAP